MPKVVVYNTQTNSTESVEPAEALAGVKSGKYTELPQSKSYTDQGRAVPIQDVKTAEDLGAKFESGATAAQAAREAQSKASLSSWDSKAQVFADGVIDALSLGFIHGHGTEIENQREENPKTAFLGEAAGTAATLGIGGPAAKVLKGGEAAGKFAAQAVIRGAENRLARAGERAIIEASAGAALSGAMATTHQLGDAIIENKPFSGEAILNEAGTGAIFGGGLGGLGGFLSKGRAARAAITGQGGILDAASHDSQFIHGEIDAAKSAYSDAIDYHQAHLGVIKDLAEKGVASQGMVEVRSAALKDALKARDALEKLKVTDEGYSQAWDKYQSSVEALDSANKMTPGERLPRHYETGLEGTTPVELKPFDNTVQDFTKRPTEVGPTELSDAVDVHMAANDTAQQRFRDIYGRDYVPYRDRIDMQAAEDAKASNVSSPSTEAATNANRIKRPAPEPAPIQDLPIKTTEQNGQQFAQFLDNVDKTNPGKRGVMAAEQASEVTNPGRVSMQPREPVPVPPENLAAGTNPTEINKTQVNDSARINAALDKGASKAPTQLDAPPTISDEYAKTQPAVNEVKPIDKTVRNLMNQWEKESGYQGPVARPVDAAEARMRQAIDNIQGRMGSRLDSAGGLNASELLNLPKASTPMGDRIQQLYMLRKLAAEVADATGGKSKGSKVASGAAGWFKKAIAGRIGAKVASAIIGGHFGGPIGFYIGAKMVEDGAATVGRIGASAAKTAEVMRQATTKLLAGGRSMAIARGTTASIANTAHQYDEDGPIQNPAQRIEKIHNLANNPDLVRASVEKKLGDLPYIMPDVAQSIVDNTVNRIQAISMRAPKFMWDAMGREVNPGANVMRQFFEYENAANNLTSILQSIKSGSLSRCQADALRECWPEAQMEMVKQLYQGQDKFKTMNAQQRDITEKILGSRVFSDPNTVMRHQGAWMQANDQRQQQLQGSQPPNGSSGKPQAFKIDKHNPATQPTSTQAATAGRAPGN